MQRRYFIVCSGRGGASLPLPSVMERGMEDNRKVSELRGFLGNKTVKQLFKLYFSTRITPLMEEAVLEELIEKISPCSDLPF